MAQRPSNFGPVSRLLADAVGRPGQRAFRILVESERGTACLWVEREQLQALAMLIEQLLSGWPAIQIHGGQAGSAARAVQATEFPSKPDVDFRVGQLSLGYDEKSSIYILLVHSVDSQPDDEPDLSCQATRAQLRAMSETIPPLLAAGRPRCPMCDRPLGSGKHTCERTNGHVRGVES